jgi:predicted porin
MNKKLIALAVAGAVCAPVAALADESTVTIYGKINVGVESIQATGATNSAQDVKSRIRVIDDYSYIGFRGVEPLGGNLNAFFQVEQLVKADGPGGNLTTGGASSNTWASRNSGVGLRGGFGEILLGRWDVYYSDHVVGGLDATFTYTDMASTALAILSQDGNLTSAHGLGPGFAFAGGRLNNIVRYASPNWGGFSFRANYQAPEGKTAAAPCNNCTPDLWNGVLQFQTPNFAAAYSYIKGNDQGSIASNEYTGHKVALSGTFSGFQVGAVGERLQHKADAGVVSPLVGAQDCKRNVYAGFAGYRQGPFGVSGTYGVARNVSGTCPLGTDDTGAKYYQLTGTFNFSKRTNVYLTYAKVANDAHAAYDFFNQGGLSDTTPIGAGSDPQTIVIGIGHFF